MRVMQRSWEFPGGYATWRMTITLDPPEGGDNVDLKCWDWSEQKLAALIGHFEDSAALWELLEAAERASEWRWPQ